MKQLRARRIILVATILIVLLGVSATMPAKAEPDPSRVLAVPPGAPPGPASTPIPETEAALPGDPS
jgi:hypothetical protein